MIIQIIIITPPFAGFTAGVAHSNERCYLARDAESIYEHGAMILRAQYNIIRRD